MSDPMDQPVTRMDALLITPPTTRDAIDATRALVQKRAMESAELILAELGIEES
jgi:hypothetical protein